MEFLQTVYPTEFESGADRQRRLYREHGTWDRVLDEMKHRWVTELDDLLPAPNSNYVTPAGQPK
jgi:hypothetical protein